uniref:Uncharacterized protein n=1 Tax=Spodoptera litura multicapsid nucleopolyhedrovirus TaxID=46242 RepID=A0A6B9UYV3_NPVST|nr:hypothetical protein [Spodoptera litura nucleopolyhedrovirus]
MYFINFYMLLVTYTCNFTCLRSRTHRGHYLIKHDYEHVRIINLKSIKCFIQLQHEPAPALI